MQSLFDIIVSNCGSGSFIADVMELKREKDPTSVEFAASHSDTIQEYWCAGRSEDGFYYDLVHLYVPCDNDTFDKAKTEKCVMSSTCRTFAYEGHETGRYSPKIVMCKRGGFCKYTCNCEDDGRLCIHVLLMFKFFCRSNDGHCVTCHSI